jgi:hypothetical protein
MKDVKLVSKNGNFGSGNLDWSFKDGVVEYVEDQEAVCQAIEKATISSIDPVSGYGINVRELRGQKDELAFRGILIMRILQTLTVLEKWYGTSFDLTLIDMSRGKDDINILVQTSIGEVKVVV